MRRYTPTDTNSLQYDRFRIRRTVALTSMYGLCAMIGVWCLAVVVPIPHLSDNLNKVEVFGAALVTGLTTLVLGYKASLHFDQRQSLGLAPPPPSVPAYPPPQDAFADAPSTAPNPKDAAIDAARPRPPATAPGGPRRGFDATVRTPRR